MCNAKRVGSINNYIIMKNLKDCKSVELSRNSLASLTGGAVWTTLDGVAQGDFCNRGVLIQTGGGALNTSEPCADSTMHLQAPSNFVGN